MKIDKNMLLIGGAALVGAFIFKDQICQAVPGIPLLCDIGKVPAGGGVQMTKAGPRNLAGPDDLPPAYYAGAYY